MAKKRATKKAKIRKVLSSAEGSKLAARTRRRGGRGTRISDVLEGAVTKTDAFRATATFSEFRKNLIYTGELEWDLNLRPVHGSRIQVVGDQHKGKTLFTYKMIGAVQRTCRQCFTPIITFVNEQTGEVAKTCLCGQCDPGRAIYLDIEKEFDPAWAAIWDVQLGGRLSMDDNSDDFEEVEDGLRVGPDSTFAICRVKSAEQAGEIVASLIRQSAVDIVALDSVAALLPQEMRDGKAQPAMLARAMTKFFSHVNGAQTDSWIEEGVDPTFLFTNQFRMDIGVMNARADNRKAAGGNAAGYSTMQAYRVNTRYNQSIDGGFKMEHIIADMNITMTKDKMGGETGRSAHARLFLRDYKQGKTTYYAGDSGENGKLYEIIKYLGEGDDTVGLAPDPRWFEKRKGKYVLLGREFTNVAGIHEFLGREDVRFMLRLPILATLTTSATARAHISTRNYMYSPFLQESDVIWELLDESKERVGKIDGRSQSAATQARVEEDDGLSDL